LVHHSDAVAGCGSCFIDGQVFAGFASGGPAMWNAFFFVQRQHKHGPGFKRKLSDGKVSGAPYSYVSKI
jgi:hypothetical protein